MLNFDVAALDAIIEQYSKRIEEIREDEMYKWEAAYNFQQHWDPDASDFAAMLESAFSKAENLLVGASWFPVGMLRGFADNDPVAVREAMLALFDESQPLKGRMMAFEGCAEEWLEKENSKRLEADMKLAKNHFQDSRSMSVYLAFHNPEQHYLYKTEMYRTFARRLGLAAPGNKFDKVVAYRELCDAVLRHLEGNWKELIARSDALLPAELQAVDPLHHLLVQDIIYYVATHMLEEESLELDEGEVIAEDAEVEYDPTTSEKNYWWLNASPKIWSFSEIAIGDEQSYTLFNEKGNPRRIQKNFLAAQPGDVIVGYEATPAKKVVSLCEVSRPHDDERMYFKKVRDLKEPVTLETVKADELLSGMEFMRNPNGSFFALTDEEFARLEEYFEEESSPVANRPDPYDDAAFLADVFMDAEGLAELKELLRRKKNVILQGAPGTGKTFAAKRLAWTMMGCKDSSRIQQVQFHQSTSYDDFVYGYRPNADGGFEPTPGVFVEFCKKAAARPNDSHFFIIDEINRANISKVFGELLMLIEADHRGESIVLPVSGERFSVPSNVYLIGMMNTADRGLALIDYALRRRFAFFEMEPALKNERFEERAALSGEKMSSLVYAVVKLNESIEQEASLGRGFRIGHSYFCPGANDEPVDPASVVKYELAPLIEEYWFDDEKRARSEIAKLKGAVE